MPIVRVDLPHAPYDIHIEPGLLDDGALIAAHIPQKRAAIVSNETVAPLYLVRLKAALARHQIETIDIVLPDGEQYKDWPTLNRIFDVLLEARCERKTTLIALGGGVIGDITGFAAALYQRGAPFIQVPTTLLAQVDSSVGGKTAINHPLGKNMIGAFYQPRLVLTDVATLATLPQREFSAGLAEVIKYGLIDDFSFFEWLEGNLDKLLARDAAAMAYAIERSCQDKARIVMADEKEEGVRALLNLGHTFGHAIEAGLGYGVWLHGEAVAAGMVLAAQASQLLGNLSAEEVARVTDLIAAAGLPVVAPSLGVERWLALMAHDKKVSDGRIKFVLMQTLGLSYSGYLEEALLRQLLR